MATTRATFGSVLSVVTTSAGAVVSLLDNVNSGLDMLSMSIQSMKHEQTVRNKLEAVAMEDRLIAEASTAATLADLATLEFMNKSEQHFNLYETNSLRFKAALSAK